MPENDLITNGDLHQLNGDSAETNVSRPIMFDQVLMEEYAALKVLTDGEIKEINNFRKKRGRELKIVSFTDTKELPRHEQAEQMQLRQQRRSEVLHKMREILHRSPSRKTERVYQKYRDFFNNDKENFKPEIIEIAAILATRQELETNKKIDNEKEVIEIYTEAAQLTEKNFPGKDILHSLIKAETSKSITALCFSGGGIRSATFGLGVLQALSKWNLLDKFTYLSTVSGGGYIGGWLSAYAFRTRKNENGFERKNIQEVQRQLNECSAEKPEVHEITHLRTFSNYLSPALGLLSADTWTLAAVYLRNLFLNWTVIIPLLAAFLLLPKIFLSLLDKINTGRLSGIFPAIPLGADWFEYFLLATPWCGLIGIIFVNMMRPSVKNYSYGFLDQGYITDEIGTVKPANKVLLLCVLPTFILVFGVCLYWFWKGEVIPFALSDGVRYAIDYLYPTAQNLPNVPARLLKFIYLCVSLFLAGYLISWLAMLVNFLKSDTAADSFGSFGKFVKTYLSEPFYSMLAGIVSGSLLYLVLEKLLGNPSTAQTEGYLESIELYSAFAVPLILLSFLASATIFVAFAVKITDDNDREWMASFGARILMIIVGWAVIFSTVIFGQQLFSRTDIFGSWDGYVKTFGGIFAFVSGAFTVLSGFSGKTPAEGEEQEKSSFGLLISIASSVIAPLVVLLLFALIAFLTDYLTGKLPFAVYNQTSWFIILALIGGLMGLFININKFSFHSTYRERLIRAYLGASRKRRLEEANSFTGLNTEKDNLDMNCLKQKPFHVVNMTLNLVNTRNLRWQNRKAESFTVSALHSGSSNMGGSGNYRSSDEYGYNKQNNRPITLGTAIAISGAAASPNMGYFTMGSAVSFLMVLLNVRLGWWLGNPGRRGRKTYNRSAPFWSPTAFLIESLGLTNDEKGYVYLADGGQFENLGLYEMVLRRCKTIIVCDGGSDANFTFFDLGSAIHKIRVDMGIPIEFTDGCKPTKGRNCAIAKIRYSAVDKNNEDEDGTLIYIKPTLDGNQPIDIVQYQSVNKDFPHEGTLDQFYSETQFESYRRLGFEMIKSICRKKDKINSTFDFIEACEKYLDEQIQTSKTNSN